MNPRPLRAQLSAAPLKPVFVRHAHRPRQVTPRSIERGPVEAPFGGDKQLETGATPRSIERGPVEACGSANWSAGCKFTPRSIERGPVEATASNGTTIPTPSTPRSIERGPVEAIDPRRLRDRLDEHSALN